MSQAKRNTQKIGLKGWHIVVLVIGLIASMTTLA